MRAHVCARDCASADVSARVLLLSSVVRSLRWGRCALPLLLLLALFALVNQLLGSPSQLNNPLGQRREPCVLYFAWLDGRDVVVEHTVAPRPAVGDLEGEEVGRFQHFLQRLVRVGDSNVDVVAREDALPRAQARHLSGAP
jgi:hypothetical protein